MEVKALSLFSGCGGMDLGLQGGFQFLSNSYKRHPIDIIFAVDHDPYAVKIYNENFNICLTI